MYLYSMVSQFIACTKFGYKMFAPSYIVGVIIGGGSGGHGGPVAAVDFEILTLALWTLHGKKWDQKSAMPVSPLTASLPPLLSVSYGLSRY